MGDLSGEKASVIRRDGLRESARFLMLVRHAKEDPAVSPALKQVVGLDSTEQKLEKRPRSILRATALSGTQIGAHGKSL